MPVYTAPGGASITIDTRANLLASTPAKATAALASDTLEFALWTGSAWYFAPLEMDPDPAAPDMGPYNKSGNIDGLGVSDKQGYYAGMITNKILHHIIIGANDYTQDGALRVSSGELQAYLNGLWNTIVLGFRFAQDATYQVGELEFKPLGYANYYGVANGNGNDLGFNGLPIVQQYTASQGVYPAKLVIDCGSF